jgi:hypothetical protein
LLWPSYTSTLNKKKNSFPLGYYVPENRSQPDVPPKGAYYTPYSEDFKVEDIDESFRIVIYAPSGKGKTFLIRGIFDNIALRGMLGCFSNDIGGEMWSSYLPNRFMYSQMRRMLPKSLKEEVTPDFMARVGLEPQGIPVEDMRIYSPEFVYRKGTIPFTYRFDRLSIPQAMALLNIRSDYKLEKRALVSILKLAKRYRKAGFSIYSKEALERMEVDLPKEVSRGLPFIKTSDIIKPVMEVMNALLFAHEQRQIDGKYPISPTEMPFSEDGREIHTVVDWSHERADERVLNKGAYQTYLSSYIFEMYEMKKQGTIKKPMVIFGDEMQSQLKEVGGKEPNAVAKACRVVSTEGRKHGVSSVWAFQDITGIPKIYLQNATHVILGPVRDPTQLAGVKKVFSHIFEGDKDEIKNNMSTLQGLGMGELLGINLVTTEWGKFVAYPPRSLHKTQVSVGGRMAI